MICKVRKTLCKYLMTDSTDEIIVGFSGGADSACLLYILYLLKDEFNFKLKAAHVNHCLRGEESERDENFVRDFCSKFSIPLYLKKVDVFTEAKTCGKSIEEYGREVRYDFFNLLSGSTTKIATAHNLNDCEETMLFNLTRGSSLKGLCSIPPVRGNIIRPLIECSRNEIEKFCDENKINFVNDSTNFSDEYTRNKIRLNVIPVLKEINPSFDESFYRCVSSLRDDEKFLSDLADDLFNKIKLDFGFDSFVLNNSDVALKNRVISRIIYEKCNVIPERKHIEAVSSILDGGKTEIICDEIVIVRNGRLFFESDIEKNRVHESKVVFDENNFWTNQKLSLKISSECTQKVYKEMLLSTFDYDKIVGELVVRKRQEGDKIALPVRKVTKTLKKLFNEIKINPEERDNLFVLADEKSVIWVEKIGSDIRVMPDNNTKSFVNISLSE